MDDGCGLGTVLKPAALLLTLLALPAAASLLFSSVIENADAVDFLPPFSLLFRFLMERSRFYYCYASDCHDWPALIMTELVVTVATADLPDLLCWL